MHKTQSLSLKAPRSSFLSARLSLTMTTVAQINATLQAALSSVGYTSNTNGTQVKQDLNSALTNLTALNSSIQALPTTNISTVQILTIVPQGITLAVSAVRATSSIKVRDLILLGDGITDGYQNLSSPLTPEEGTAILAISQNAQVQLVSTVNTYASKINAVEAAVPGLSKFALTTLKSIVDSLIQALSAAAPPNISPSTIQQLQSSINAAIQNALARVPA